MTRRRRGPPGRLWLGTIATGIFTALLGACASLPEDAPVLEQLDNETGLTIARLGHPMELYRETFMQRTAGRFAFIAPFETNQMGSRELYLWVALPVDPAPGLNPVIEADGVVLDLPSPGRDAGAAGLTASPYRIPTPWSAMFYYKVDAALIAKLGDTSKLSIQVTETTKDGTVKTLFAASVPDGRLKEFATR